MWHLYVYVDAEVYVNAGVYVFLEGTIERTRGSL